MHILGELCGGTGFGAGAAVACKWAIEVGDQWVLLEGAKNGQTQTDTPDAGSDVVVWGHPLEAHYVVGAMAGWPRLIVQVSRLDEAGRLEVEGYGVAHIPSTAGCHEISIPTWRPLGTASQEMAAFFVGGVPSLRSSAVVSAAASERYRLVTTSSGSVHARVDLITRHLDHYAVDL